MFTFQMLDYNLSGGKLFRSTVFRSLISTMDHGQPLEVLESLELCLETLQACCLIADDIVDKSPTRRGMSFNIFIYFNSF